MTLLTTVQVRTIMRENGGLPEYTNKSKGHKGKTRRVKAYLHSNTKMVDALIAACGAENVNITKSISYVRGGGYGNAVTVRCVLE